MPDNRKETLRRDLRTRRQSLHKSADTEISEKLASNFFKALPGLFPNTVVGGYYPMGSEIDALPIMGALAENGTRIALPVVVKEDAPLEFYPYKNGDKLAKGLEGAMEPLVMTTPVQPDILLVPLLGFDDAGNRIGQGKGYYDRTLEALRKDHAVLAIGLAFEGQREAALPTEKHDEPLDAVITETTCRVFQSGKAA